MATTFKGFTPTPPGDTAKPKPKASVSQALSPTEIARRQAIAGQQMRDALPATGPKGGYGVSQANAYQRAASTPAYQPTGAGGYSSSSQSLTGAVPQNRDVSLASIAGVNDPTAVALGSAVPNAPGTQNAGTSLPQNGTDIANWTFNGSDTAWSPRDLETMLNDPYSFQRQFLQSQGMNTPGANAALGQFASRLNPLSMILGGANLAPGDQGNLEAIAQIYEGLLNNYTTPGGRMPDIGEIMGILAGVGNIDNGGSPTSVLQALLAGEDPQGQVSAIQQILGAGLAGMPGLWGRGWSNMLDQAGTNYLDSTMDAYNGPDATMLDYLRNDPFLSRVR